MSSEVIMAAGPMTQRIWLPMREAVSSSRSTDISRGVVLPRLFTIAT